MESGVCAGFDAIAHHPDADNQQVVNGGPGSPGGLAGYVAVGLPTDPSILCPGLFANNLFQKAETLDFMLAGDVVEDGLVYGCGIFSAKTGVFTLCFHAGYWGSWMAWIPERQLSITGTVNHAGSDFKASMGSIIPILRHILV